MLSYNSLTYVQDMKIGHYSRFTWSPDADTLILQVNSIGIQ